MSPASTTPKRPVRVIKKNARAADPPEPSLPPTPAAELPPEPRPAAASATPRPGNFIRSSAIHPPARLRRLPAASEDDDSQIAVLARFEARGGDLSAPAGAQRRPAPRPRVPTAAERSRLPVAPAARDDDSEAALEDEHDQRLAVDLFAHYGQRLTRRFIDALTLLLSEMPDRDFIEFLGEGVAVGEARYATALEETRYRVRFSTVSQRLEAFLPPEGRRPRGEPAAETDDATALRTAREAYHLELEADDLRRLAELIEGADPSVEFVEHKSRTQDAYFASTRGVRVVVFYHTARAAVQLFVPKKNFKTAAQHEAKLLHQAGVRCGISLTVRDLRHVAERIEAMEAVWLLNKLPRAQATYRLTVRGRLLHVLYDHARQKIQTFLSERQWSDLYERRGYRRDEYDRLAARSRELYDLNLTPAQIDLATGQARRAIRKLVAHFQTGRPAIVFLHVGDRDLFATFDQNTDRLADFIPPDSPQARHYGYSAKRRKRRIERARQLSHKRYLRRLLARTVVPAAAVAGEESASPDDESPDLTPDSTQAVGVG